MEGAGHKAPDQQKRESPERKRRRKRRAVAGADPITVAQFEAPVTRPPGMSGRWTLGRSRRRIRAGDTQD